MSPINRRKFIAATLHTTAALSLPGLIEARAETATDTLTPLSDKAPGIIDTNVNLFDFPFRKLKYGTTEALVKKLHKHRVVRAWAGNFEALFSKNLDSVNARLAEECRKKGKNMLIPFGSVNPSWPDWEEDVRRCHEQYGMPGIRIFPLYQTIDFGSPAFARLLQIVAERGLILQIVGDVEDTRHVHPIVTLRNTKFDLLPDLLKKEPHAKVQLLHWNGRVGGKLLDRLIAETNVVLDISRLESNGAVGRLIEGNMWNGGTKPVPVERLLFGSHVPYFPLEANLLRLFESPLSLDQLTAIMHRNAERFLTTSQS